ncbi:MAG TPA: 23S rRNA (pseudouridine(1915)-N(3))-methyltransferase RlmH [Beijerinckiaceae bacterium]
MKLAVISVGRLKEGPERDLVDRYRERVEALGRSHGLSPLQLVEIAESRGRREDERRAEEGAAILDKAATSVVIAFDERGRSLTSEALAQRIAAWRDEGRDRLVCVIGGPDGLDPRVRNAADLVLAFGSLTLPHQLVRALVVEQLYRVLTILAGHPYHRTGG